MALSGGEALVSPRVKLLCCSDLQGVVVLSLDGDVLVGDNGLRVAVPVDGVFWGALHSAGEEQGAADASFQILRGQGHTKWIWEKDMFVRIQTCEKIYFFYLLVCAYSIFMVIYKTAV